MGTRVIFRIIKSVAALSIIMLLIGCGGGGGGSSTNNDSTPKTFKLFPDGYFTAGYQETYSLTGSDSDGYMYTASQSIQTASSEVLDGETVIPIDILFTLTNTSTHAFATVSQTDYYTSDSNNRLYIGSYDNTFDVAYEASSTGAIPLTAKIDDFGSVGIYESTDGETETVTWKLTDANNGLAKLILSISYTNSSGNLTSSEEQTFVIDQNGNRKSFSVRLYDTDDGSTMDLSGSIQ